MTALLAATEKAVLALRIMAGAARGRDCFAAWLADRVPAGPARVALVSAGVLAAPAVDAELKRLIGLISDGSDQIYGPVRIHDAFVDEHQVQRAQRRDRRRAGADLAAVGHAAGWPEWNGDIERGLGRSAVRDRQQDLTHVQFVLLASSRGGNAERRAPISSGVRDGFQNV